MPRTARRSAVPVLVLLATALAATSPKEDVDSERVLALVQRVDPAADDWGGEAFVAGAREQLAAVALALTAGPAAVQGLSDALFADAASASRLGLTDSAAGAATHGGFRIRHGLPRPASERMPVRSALAEIAASWGSRPDARFDLEVVGVERGEAGAWRTRVRAEAAGRGPDGLFQEIAEWNLEWRAGAPPAAPRIVSIALSSFEQTQRAQPLFTDCSGSVLPSGAAWYAEVALGEESWHGRLDAIGEPMSMGRHGIAIGDVNGDGLEDLYVAQGNGLPNRLLVQSANGTVRDVAAEAGVDWLDDTKGVLFADMDNDGDQDLLAAMGPTVVLAKNDGHGRFDRFVGLRAPTAGEFHSIAVADYDLDGDLDVYATRYVKRRFGRSVPVPFYDANNGPTNHLLRNDGEDRYTDVTVEAGLMENNGRFSSGAAWADYDRDGDPDLYVANDFGPDNLYRNDGGRFVDVAAAAGVDDPGAGTGVSFADYDLDGDLDLQVTDVFSAAGMRVTEQPEFQPGASPATRDRFRSLARGGSLFANQGDGTFRDASDAAGIRGGGWGFGGRFVDLDGDNLDDLVVPQGLLTGAADGDLSSFYWRRVASSSPPMGPEAEQDEDYLAAWAALARLALGGPSWDGHQRTRALLNLGGGRFADVSHASGLDAAADGRAVAAVDWDGDGDLDLWFANRSGPRLRFLRNDGDRTAGRRSVAFLLQGTHGNRDAIGAMIEIRAGDRRLTRTVGGGDGSLAQSSRWLSFGLDRGERIDGIVVVWPGGEREELRGVSLDRRYVVKQGTGKAVARGRRSVRLAAAPVKGTPFPPGPVRVLLKTPLPLPPTLRKLGDAQVEPGRARLYQLGTPDCEACRTGLADLETSHAELHAAGLDVVALPADAEVRQLVQAVLEHVLQQPGGRMTLPVGFLVDTHGDIQLIYLGVVGPTALGADVRQFLDREVPGAQRSLYGGRWYYRTARDLLGLSWELKRLGLREDARHYLAVHELGTSQKSGVE